MELPLEDALDTVADVINKVPSLNEFITTTRQEVNPLSKFVTARVRYELGSETLLGSKTYNRFEKDNIETLYGAYQAFNRAYGDESLKPFSFSEQFVNNMNSLGKKDVLTKRTNRGVVVLNVKLVDVHEVDSKIEPSQNEQSGGEALDIFSDYGEMDNQK